MRRNIMCRNISVRSSFIAVAYLSLGVSTSAGVCGGQNQAGIYGIVPLPKSFELTPYSTTCAMNKAGLAYDNSDFSDGNGPRGAYNASDCCAQCAAASDCNFWSFAIDPSLPSTPNNCRWANLNYCCVLHKSGGNLVPLAPDQPSKNEFGIKGNWQSGSIQPTTALSMSDAEHDGVTDDVAPSKTELVFSHETTRINAASAALEPLANLLSEDIYGISGVHLNVSKAGAAPRNGDITISLEPGLSQPSYSDGITKFTDDESYSLEVSGKAAAITCKVSMIIFQTSALYSVASGSMQVPCVCFACVFVRDARSLTIFCSCACASFYHCQHCPLAVPLVQSKFVDSVLHGLRMGSSELLADALRVWCS